MEYCKEGTLKDYLQKNTTIKGEVLISFLCQMSKCFSSLHQGNSKLIHRDLKPENILIQEIKNGIPVFKLGDFGISKKIEKTMQTATTAGTLSYCPPEVLFYSKQSPNSDLWSLGVILYEMVTKILPFGLKPHMGVEEMKHGILNVCKFMLPSDLPEYLIILLKRLLVSDPSKRLKWNDFFKIFSEEAFSEPVVVLMNKTEFDVWNSLMPSKYNSCISTISGDSTNRDPPNNFIYSDYCGKLFVMEFKEKILRTHQIESIPGGKGGGRGSIQIEENIYFIGGMDFPTTYHKTNHNYSLQSLRISKLADSSFPKAWMGVCAHSDNIYSIGGQTTDQIRIDNCENYNIKLNTWRKIPNLNQKKWGVASAINSQYIYAFGGDLGFKYYTNTIEQFNLDHQKWVILQIPNNQHLPKVWGAGVVSNKNFLLVFGGFNERGRQSLSTLINLDKMEVTLTKPLPQKSTFYYNPTCSAHGKICALTYDKLPQSLVFSWENSEWKREKLKNI